MLKQLGGRCLRTPAHLEFEWAVEADDLVGDEIIPGHVPSVDKALLECREYVDEQGSRELLGRPFDTIARGGVPLPQEMVP